MVCSKLSNNVRRSQRKKNKESINNDTQNIERMLNEKDDSKRGLEIVLIKGKGRGIKVLFKL